MLFQSILLLATLSSVQVFGADLSVARQKTESLSGEYELVNQGSDSSCVKGVVTFESHNISYKSQKNRRFDEVGFRIFNKETTEIVVDISDINEGNVFHRNENPMCNKPYPCYDRWQFLKTVMDDLSFVSVHGYAKSSIFLNRPRPEFDGIFNKTTVQYSDHSLKIIHERRDTKSLETHMKQVCIYKRI